MTLVSATQRFIGPARLYDAYTYGKPHHWAMSRTPATSQGRLRLVQHVPGALPKGGKGRKGKPSCVAAHRTHGAIAIRQPRPGKKRGGNGRLGVSFFRHHPQVAPAPTRQTSRAGLIKKTIQRRLFEAALVSVPFAVIHGLPVPRQTRADLITKATQGRPPP